MRLSVFCSMLVSAATARAELGATPADQIRRLPGFRVELLYSVPPLDEGSWVALTLDNRERIIASDQFGRLYRITPPPVVSGDADEPAIEPIDLNIGMAHGLLYAFDSLYVCVNTSDNRKPPARNGAPVEPSGGSGLYRARDTDGDDRYDEVKLLRKFDGAGDHGPHGLALAPDGKSIYVCIGNKTRLPRPERSLVPRVWSEDFLLTRLWDPRGHARGVLAPGGAILRTDPDGREFEIFSTGFRNQYDLAFNPDGELFTYDSDMEWDIGTPWYRPTRVNHVTSGSDFGWRSGTANAPDYYADSLGSVVDIGPGSPTGVAFGTGAKFPEKYQRALYIADWSYGNVYAVHLTPDGSSYTGAAEKFLSAQPLPVTDMLVHPDGALYFAIGGRETQSGLYRVTYEGSERHEPVAHRPDGGEAARAARRQLEALHAPGPAIAVDSLWSSLGDEDRALRSAARVALENQPVDTWRDRVAAEPDPRTAIHAVIALARHGNASDHAAAIETLSRIDWLSLTRELRLDLLRAYAVVFARLGAGSDAARQSVVQQLDAAFPESDRFINRELARLLIHLEAPRVAERALVELMHARTQEDELHYALMLMDVRSGWTLPMREEYFRWFNKGAALRGGKSFGGFLSTIRGEALAKLTPEEQEQLAPLLDAKIAPVDPLAELQSRPFVRKWTVADLLPVADARLVGRDFENGREMFAVAACFKCHRVRGEGGATGPDLTGLGGRFNHRNLLESIVEPSKVISDQYEMTQFVLKDGRSLVGRVVNLTGENIWVLTDVFNPGSVQVVKRSELELLQPSAMSMMPEGLLDRLAENDVLDLVAYLKAGGDASHPAFAKTTAATEPAAPPASGLLVQATAPRNPDPAQVEDDPRLPRVLIIGDSISIGYTAPVRELLRGKANVHRIPANGGPTTRGLDSIEGWLGDGHWDVIHFNFGLHDQMYRDAQGKTVPVAEGRPQVSLDQYEKNLDALTTRLKRTNAKLLWATTTPVPPTDKARVPADAVKYNAAALRVMEEHGVAVNDLEAFAETRLAEIQRPGNVHFTEEGYRVLAQQVARSIENSLLKTRTPGPN